MRRLRLPLLIASLLCAIGCGDGRIHRYPVSGVVMVNGKPAEGAMVIFCPATGDTDFMRERPWGETDSAGAYRLTTFDKNDGAPAGDYQVMIRWPEKDGRQYSDDPERTRRSRDRLGGKYFNPQQSGLTATVEQGPTEVPPFELTAKR